jgi:hypothetical protein
LEPHAIAKTFERRYVTIEGVEYDVTDFKHPGGSVIYYMLSNTGADATEAFKEFHYRSKKARKALAALPHKPVDAATREPIEDEAMLKDFAQWRKELEREGFFKPSPAHVAYRFAELAAMFALGTALMHARWHVASVIVYSCFFGARCGWVQHEGGHNSLTGNIWWDKRIQAFAAGFGLASSGTTCTTSITRRPKRCDTIWISTPLPRWRSSTPRLKKIARGDSVSCGCAFKRGPSCP